MLHKSIKFLLVGGLNTVTTFALYALLVVLGVNYNLALIIVYLTGILISFSLNKKWTFSNNNRDGKEGSAISLGLKYLTTYLAVFLVNLLILNALVTYTKLSEIPGQFIAIIFATIVSYVLQNGWVFKKGNI